MWTTTAGLFVRINGGTVGPLGSGGGGGGTVTSITAGTGLTGGTITTSGTIAIDQAAQIVSTRANSTTTGAGQIYLNGATGNRIDFNLNGIQLPAQTTRSAGTKLVLYPSLNVGSNLAVDYAFGIGAGTLWSSIPFDTNVNYFSWYGSTTPLMALYGDGQLRLGGGTALLPAISPGLANSLDINTGIFFPAADTIAFSEGGTEVMRIDSSARVAIGTTSATARLQVRGSGATAGTTALRVENSSGTGALEIMDDGQLRVGAGTAILPSISAGLNSSDTNTGIYFPGTDQMALVTNGVGRLFVSNTGVGIGANPVCSFDCQVSGDILISTSNASLGINVTRALAYTHIGSDPARQSGPLYLRIDAEQVSCDPPTWQTTDFNDIYGNGGINGIILGEPDYWMEIRLGHATHSGKGGSIVLIPCYIPSNQC
jgi:hypothetical protein